MLSLFSPLRLVGVFFLGIAAGLFAADASRWSRGEGWAPRPLGQVIFELHANAYTGFNSFVENTFGPQVWDTAIAPAMNAPSWILPGVFGLLLILIKQIFFRRPR